jgi:hypothetical protein
LDKLQEFMQVAEQMHGSIKQDVVELHENIDEMRQNLKAVQSLDKVSQLTQMAPEQNVKITTCAKSLNAKLNKLQQFLQTGEAVSDQFMEKFGTIATTIQEIQIDLNQIESLQRIGQVTDQQGSFRGIPSFQDQENVRMIPESQQTQGYLQKRYVDVDLEVPAVAGGLYGAGLYGGLGYGGIGYGGWDGVPNYWGNNWGGYGNYYAPNYWGGYGGYYGGNNRAATIAQCHSLAAGQTTRYMRDAYLAACASYY